MYKLHSFIQFNVNVEISWRHTSKENKEIPILYFQVNAFKLDFKKNPYLICSGCGITGATASV